MPRSAPDRAADDRARVVRAHSARLIAAQVLLWITLGAWARLATVQIDELTDRPAMAGVAVALYYVASGAGARTIGRRMDRRGRRDGLLVAYAILGIGGILSFVAVLGESAAFLLAGTFVVGLGSGGALLGRAAVADMHPPSARGRAIGRLVIAGVPGAVAGPFIASAIQDLAGPAAPWLAVPAACAGALAALWPLRPDPRELSPEAAEAPVPAAPAEAVAPMSFLRTRPGAAAAVTIGLSQAVMATFMAIVPVVLNREHAAHGTVSLVVSLHLGAMFAFSPSIGSFLDRRGRKAGLLLGLSLAACGVVLCALPPITVTSTAGLFLVGVGWSAAYLGSTALVSDLAGTAGRARALGTIDLVASLSAAAGVLGGAALVQASGIASLGAVAAASLVAPLALVAVLREPSPGRWRLDGPETGSSV